MTVSAIIDAIAADKNKSSGWVRLYRTTLKPDNKIDLYICGDDCHLWIRANGQWVSGSGLPGRFGYRPNIIDRWRLRRAVRRWDQRQPCGIRQYSDQMLCDCGLTYDTNDPAPPTCRRTGQRLP